MRPVASSVSLQSAAAKAAALPEARRRRPEQQEGSGSHPAEADRRGSSGAEGPTIITDFVDRRGGSSRQTGFTGHTTHENACDRRPQENRCPSHKQIFSTNPPRALGAGRGGEKYPPCRSLISEQNQNQPGQAVGRQSVGVGARRLQSQRPKVRTGTEFRNLLPQCIRLIDKTFF